MYTKGSGICGAKVKRIILNICPIEAENCVGLHNRMTVQPGLNTKFEDTNQVIICRKLNEDK